MNDHDDPTLKPERTLLRIEKLLEKIDSRVRTVESLVNTVTFVGAMLAIVYFIGKAKEWLFH